LCSVTLFALYVSTVYNSAIATSNTDIIVNSVIVLFVMEMDEWIFSTLEAINEKWTKHAESGDTSSDDTDAEKGSTIDEMKDEIELQKAQIAEQQEELDLQKGKMARQSDEIALLREAVQQIQDSIAVAAITSSESTPQCAANECVNTHEAESEAEDTDDMEDYSTVPCDVEQEIEKTQVAVSAAISISDSGTVSECVDDTKTEV